MNLIDYSNISDDMLVQKLINYRYNKSDNNYHGVCVYKIEQNDELPNEKFIPYNNLFLSTYKFRSSISLNELLDMNITVSNYGRVKIKGKIVTQYQYKFGYLAIKITDEILYDVYRLVAETWVKCPVENTFEYDGNNCWVVHHITDNGFDNRPENLVWLSRNSHSKIHNEAKINNNILIKNNLHCELKKALDMSKDINFVTERLDDFYLLRNNDYDDKLIDQICSKYSIMLDQYLENRVIKNI